MKCFFGGTFFTGDLFENRFVLVDISCLYREMVGCQQTSAVKIGHTVDLLGWELFRKQSHHFFCTSASFNRAVEFALFYVPQSVFYIKLVQI